MQFPHKHLKSGLRALTSLSQISKVGEFIRDLPNTKINIQPGEKKAFFNAFTLRLMQQNAKMMGKPLPEESTRKGIELLAEKMTGNEVVTADELKKFFNDMLKKVKGRK